METYKSERVKVITEEEFTRSPIKNIYDNDSFPYHDELERIEVKSLNPLLHINMREGMCYSNAISISMEDNNYDLVYCYVMEEGIVVPHCIVFLDEVYYDVSPPKKNGPDPLYMKYKKFSFTEYNSLMDMYSGVNTEEKNGFYPISLDGSGYIVIVRNEEFVPISGYMEQPVSVKNDGPLNLSQKIMNLIRRQ